MHDVQASHVAAMVHVPIFVDVITIRFVRLVVREEEVPVLHQLHPGFVNFGCRTDISQAWRVLRYEAMPVLEVQTTIELLEERYNCCSCAFCVTVSTGNGLMARPSVLRSVEKPLEKSPRVWTPGGRVSQYVLSDERNTEIIQRLAKVSLLNLAGAWRRTSISSSKRGCWAGISFFSAS
jgi:hypothetical protein